MNYGIMRFPIKIFIEKVPGTNVSADYVNYVLVSLPNINNESAGTTSMLFSLEVAKKAFLI